MLVLDWIKQFFGLGNTVTDARPESNNKSAMIDEIPAAAAEVRKTAEELSSMTKKQLEEYAKEIGVEIDVKKTKANIIDTLTQ